VGAAMAAIAILIGAVGIFRPQTSVALTLSASGNNRAEGVQAAKVQLPINAAALKISLTLPAGSAAAKSYRVDMENIYEEKKSLKIAGQDAQSVTVVIPAAQLARGQYVLKLFAIKDDGSEQRLGSYYFNAE
jgi:methionine-rich copper-binding protein CopC